MRSRVLVALLVLLLAVTSSPAVAGADGAGGSGSTSTTAEVDQRIIPRPNSGVEPKDVGDRGGAAQIALMVAIFGGVVLIGFLVVRESRRARA